MLYLSQMLGKPVVDANDEVLGKISDLAISTGEVFPRITSLAFKGPANTPLMISWRKFVQEFDGDKVILSVAAPDVRFSYLQPDEILLSRDLMGKQIVDTQGLKVVRVNDIKLSNSRNQLRLLGAEVGIRGILRGLSPWIEKAALGISKLFRHEIEENIIAWNYMDLLETDLSQVKLSVTHKRLHELHPADVADILEQLDPQQRAFVFQHLDDAQAAETISELEDEYQAGVLDEMSDNRASSLLAQMDPDDAADIIGDLPYEKAETLFRLMGVSESRDIRRLLGYRDKTAGGIMTTEFVSVPEGTLVGDAIEKLRSLPEDYEPVQYVYTVNDDGKLTGVVEMRDLILSNNNTSVSDIAHRDLFTVTPDVDQEEVANDISRYAILAMPVVDEEDGKLLGIVTFDDAFEVMEEEHDEDLAIAGASRGESTRGPVLDFFGYFLRRSSWFIIWAAVACIVLLFLDAGRYLGVLVLMPLVLMIADDTTGFAVNALIDRDDEEIHLGKMIGRDVAAGLLVGLACFIILMILNTVVGVQGGKGVDAIAVLNTAILPTVITLFLTIASAALLARYAKRRHDKEKIVSSTRLSIFVMIIACAVLIALTTVLPPIGVVA